MKRRVVVTGLGMITPVGIDTEASWQGLIAGKSGIGPITQFEDKDIPTQIAGEVKGIKHNVQGSTKNTIKRRKSWPMLTQK